MNIRVWMLLIAAAVFAVPSFAQSDETQFETEQQLRPVDDVDSGGGWYGESTYTQGQYMDNPCTYVQDLVWVDYSAYVEGAQAEANENRYLFNEDTTMGGAYSASGSSTSDVAYATPFTLRKYHKVNTYDDFHVVTVINFYPDSKSTGLAVETACGNGMPDSAQ